MKKNPTTPWFLASGDVSRLRALFAMDSAILGVQLENGMSCPRWITVDLDDEAAAAWLNTAYRGRAAA